MSNIRSADMMLLNDIFDMGGGYVLNFSDKTFARFFADELKVDIGDPLYAQHGSSKGKRLRCFLQTVDKPTVVRTLKALWEYREALRIKFNKPEEVENAQGRFLALLNQLEGQSSGASFADTVPLCASDRPKLASLRTDLCSLSDLAPQQRGYAFEEFLGRLFNTHGLEAREPFRLCDEQIDGSFKLANEIYLVEAKWHDQATGVAELHTFHGKIEQKAAWTRGLFVSYGGFTDDGLVAFGRGKRVICMDGHDLDETLRREIPLNYMLDWKVRRAAETGLPFVRVRDLLTK